MRPTGHESPLASSVRWEGNPTLRLRSPRNQNLARILIPAYLGQAHYRCVVCQRRDVDRSVLHVAATGAWKESLTEGSRSRRSGLTGSGEAPVMAGSRCPPSVAQGAIARLQRWGGAGSQRMARDTNRRTRVPKGNPRDREVPESPQGSPGGPRGSPGAATSGPRVAGVGTRVPSHPSGSAPRDGRRVPEAAPPAVATRRHEKLTYTPVGQVGKFDPPPLAETPLGCPLLDASKVEHRQEL